MGGAGGFGLLCNIFLLQYYQCFTPRRGDIELLTRYNSMGLAGNVWGLNGFAVIQLQ